MSRGLGHVAAVVLAAFRQRPRGIWKTSELCRLVYEVDQIEKKHRVSVLRALRILVARGEVKIRRFQPIGERAEHEWFNEDWHGRPKYSSALDHHRSPSAKRRR
jgi:hypothetical protein